MNILDHHSFYLVGIKGVAMTALAQCLIDAKKKVSGCDVLEKFVTQKILDDLKIKIDVGFEAPLPDDIDCVIYTAAHQSLQNPQVQAALRKKIITITHAEALASLFNQKQGVAVCGVGGKSTTAAMITWILAKAAEHGFIPPQSFAIGVGNILGLEKTGQWSEEGSFFIAEADEYVIDPAAPSRGESITPRFSFLRPFVTVCTNLRYDHPDVYQNFEHTKSVYQDFFKNILPKGALVINADDQVLVEVASKCLSTQSQSDQNVRLFSFGLSSNASFQLTDFTSQSGKTIATITDHKEIYQLVLKIPGRFNVLNALAAMLVCNGIGISISDAIQFLSEFSSTMRRSELIGVKKGVTYYDDYAHHPDEIKQIIQAFKEWYPQQKVIVAFQSHTYSRTKALLGDFAAALSNADEVVMTDIFASAREEKDETVSSDLLCVEIQKLKPQLKARNLKTNQALAEYCQTQLHESDVLLTLGAGDIYHVHELI